MHRLWLVSGALLGFAALAFASYTSHALGDEFLPMMRMLLDTARDGRVDVVRLLISRRADITTPDPTTKMNALDIAIANGQDEVAAVMREAGARPGGGPR